MIVIAIVTIACSQYTHLPNVCPIKLDISGEIGNDSGVKCIDLSSVRVYCSSIMTALSA